MVSIIMALFNGEKFLDTAITSVISQEIESWELLIVDDGSIDNSFSSAKKWEKCDDRIKVFQHEGGGNKGVSATRNLAISHSTGKYLAILDCDDTWHPEKLDRQLQIFEKHPQVVMVYTKAEVIDDDGRLVRDNPEKLASLNRPAIFGSAKAGSGIFDFSDLFHHDFWFPASSVVFRRDVAERCGFFNETLKFQVEDTLLFYEVCEKGVGYFLDEILMGYRVHSSQWNAKLDHKKRLSGMCAFFLILLSKVEVKNRDLVIVELIKKCVAPLITNYISLKPDLIFFGTHIRELLTSSLISAKYKRYIVLLIAKRIIALPILLLRKTNLLHSLY